MARADFVVLDFIIQPHPDGFATAKGRKIDKRYVKWEELAERVKDKVKRLLLGVAASPPEKISIKCEVEGAADEKGHATLASFLILRPTRHHILRIEDYLRQHVVAAENGDIPEDAQPSLTVKVKDHAGRFLNFQVTDFTLSGPSKGDWKPFTQWYGALKKLGLLSNPHY